MEGTEKKTEPANTVFEYLYRDASNYKVCNEAVLKGRMTDGEFEEIRACLDEGEFFIPHMVGLDGRRFGDETEDDHPWFEVTGYRHTAAAAESGLTVGELVENFKKARGHWQDAA